MSTAARKQQRVLAFLAALAALLAVTSPLRASTLATLELSDDQVVPGQELSFHGWYYNDVHPVMIRWGGVDGPVLATVTPDTFEVVHNHFRSIAGTLRIPPDAQPGEHLLVATQDFAPPGKITWGVPARTRIRVGEGASRTKPATLRRPSRIAVSATPGTVPLVAAAAGGAALAALVAGTTLLLRTRRMRS